MYAAQPRLGEVVHPLRARGEEQDPQLRVEEVEQHLDLLDDVVVTARLEEGVPVAARPLEVVLAAGGVGEHAVEVDDRRRARARPARRARSSARVRSRRSSLVVGARLARDSAT